MATQCINLKQNGAPRVWTRAGVSLHTKVWKNLPHPILGLDNAAVERKKKDGKNVISPPPTQYWKKALNYVFGGFNFLMWLAFILTTLSYKPLGQPPEAFVLSVTVLLVSAEVIPVFSRPL